jgi:acyl-coenzyme A thioesterase PaaI-like protein
MAATDLAMKVYQALPESIRDTAFIRVLAFFKIPVISFCKPSVVELSDQKCVVKIPLNRRTRNHLNSMYFGVLCAGADVAGGLIAMRLIQAQGNKVNLVFQDMHAEFLKRAEGDVHFTCEDGRSCQDLVLKALASEERVSTPVRIVATCPDKMGNEPVAKFTLTLSLKKKGARKSA